jgi:uncharacterized protein YbaP (TraB family)
MYKLSALLFGLLFIGTGTQAISQNSLLWEIKHPQTGKTSHLFGTYHLLGSEYLEEAPKVQKAYAQAKRVVVETQIDSTKLLQFAMAGLMQQSLKELVDSAEYHLLKTELEPVLGVDLAQMDNFKPMMLSASYSMMLAQQSTPENFEFQGTPIDLYFATEGAKQGKEIVSLEDMLEQANLLFNSTTPQQQADELVAMLQEKEEAAESSKALVEAYQQQDLKKIEELGKAWGEEYGGMEALLDERNKNWMPKLKAELEKGDAFIAVGAMHLVGETGLVELLREAGYTVTPVL